MGNYWEQDQTTSRKENLSDEQEELLRLKPDFASRAADLMRRLVFSNGHVDMLMDGLRRAGLETVG